MSLLLFSEGRKLVNLWTNYAANEGIPLRSEGFVDCQIPAWPFRDQQFSVDVFTHLGEETQDWIEDCLVFESCDGDYYRSGVVTNKGQGILFLPHTWSANVS